jgi:hypothetical protein
MQTSEFDHLLLDRLIASRREKASQQQALDTFDNTVNLPLARAIYQKLTEHYRGHFWHVEVALERGLIYIQLRHLDTGGYYINPEQLKTDPGMKMVVEGGGHLLERYRLDRGAVDEAQLADVSEKVGDPLYRNNEDAPE